MIMHHICSSQTLIIYFGSLEHLGSSQPIDFPKIRQLNLSTRSRREFYYYACNTKVSLTIQLSWISWFPFLLAIASHKLNIDCSSKEIHDSLGANGIIKD